jgi:hypothetical protein
MIKKNYADWNKVQEVLKQKTGLAYFNNSRDELICRCPKCEIDSTSDHGHLYISVDSPVFNCFKCVDYHGIVTKLFHDLNLNPREYLYEDIFSGEFKQRIEPFDIKKHKIPEINQERNILKKQYLQKRLGTDFKIENIPGLVFNASEFIISNNPVVSESQKSMLPILDQNFIGFVCTRGSTVIFRNIYDNQSVKHYKLFLGNPGYFKDFYGIESGVKKLDNTIVLCEGIFDLLTAIKSPALLDIRKDSCYWAAILSKQYFKSFLSVLDYCRLPYANLVILSDVDVEGKEYKYILQHPAAKSVSVYLNNGKKDFGDGNIDLIRIDHIIKLNRRNKNEFRSKYT